MDQRPIFYGDQREPAMQREDAHRKREPYIATPELARAVNLAIYLGRPLLLEGEAGCGKTKLASAVAYQLGLPFFAWDVNSKTRVEDGLYRYDAIGRLHDVQMLRLASAPEGQSPTVEKPRITSRNPEKPDQYLKRGSLAEAFAVASKGYQAVVLIDEIDKADIDFPNDLLTTLDDDYKFRIPETGDEIKIEDEKHKPIVIITSNREKGDLPEPFLRRCIYFYVDFPDEEALKKIVKTHYADREKFPEELPQELLDAATVLFFHLRNKTRMKKPGTSEFLDWIKALHDFGPAAFKAADLDKDKPVPFPETLFKMKEDWEPHAKPR